MQQKHDCMQNYKLIYHANYTVGNYLIIQTTILHVINWPLDRPSQIYWEGGGVGISVNKGDLMGALEA